MTPQDRLALLKHRGEVRRRQESYERWRRRFDPYTDEDFALAAEYQASISAREGRERQAERHRANAARIRQGRLHRWDIREYLGLLVTTCVACGRRAIYRVGVVGLCRAHRHEPLDSHRLRCVIQDRRSRAIVLRFDESERKRAQYDQWHTFSSKRRRPKA